MDLMALSTQAVILLTPFLPYLQEAGKEIAKNIAGDSWIKAKQLYAAIKKKSTKKKEATQLLELFEKNPELYKEALAKTIMSFAETDNEFAELLRGSTNNFHDTVTSQTAIGDGNIQVANGAVTVTSFPNSLTKKKHKK